MPRYVKKPIEIEAIQYTGDNLKEVLEFVGKHPDFDKWFASFDEYEAHVKKDSMIFKVITNHGVTSALPGDWMIKSPVGEFYPCKPDIFERTYDAV